MITSTVQNLKASHCQEGNSLRHVPVDQTRPECGYLSWCWSVGRFLHVLVQAATEVCYQGDVGGLPALELLSFLYITEMNKKKRLRTV